MSDLSYEEYRFGHYRGALQVDTPEWQYWQFSKDYGDMGEITFDGKTFVIIHKSKGSFDSHDATKRIINKVKIREKEFDVIHRIKGAK